MPRVHLNGGLIQNRDQLVQTIAEELRGGTKNSQPVIYQQPIAETDTFHVIVVWDRWLDVPPSNRSSIIIDAYEEVEPDTASKITIAMGVTMNEAIELNLLPYQVVAIHSKNDSVSLETLEKVMIEEGGIRSSRGVHLAFPDQKSADEAWTRLSQKVPGDHWAIQKVVASIME